MQRIYSSVKHALLLALSGGLSITGIIYVSYLHIPEHYTQPATAEVTLERTLIYPAPRTAYEFIEITGGCDYHYVGTCAAAYAGPGYTYAKRETLRDGIVLRTESSTLVDGEQWYKVAFDEWLRYPERVDGDWYVPASTARGFTSTGPQEMDGYPMSVSTSSKYIIVDRSEQMLYAYEPEGTLFMRARISTGLTDTPTPRGTFTIYYKTPTRYMQGPLPGISEQYYDLPGVPWNLYFTQEGGAIHGAYWHNGFGHQWSHGCVNVPTHEAQQLYYWADVGTHVYVRD